MRRPILTLFSLLGLALLTGASVAARQDSITLIAHRGASWDAPEHTFAAWDLAIEAGADFIEQDIRLTRDGVLVVLHDDSLDRTARGPAESCTGLLRSRTFAELRRCEVGSWFNQTNPERASARFAGEPLPTLDSVLTRYSGRTRFYIETKDPLESPGMEEALVALLTKHRLAGPLADTGRVIVQSFSEASLHRLRELDPSLRLVRLLEDPVAPEALDTLLAGIARYADGIGPVRRILSARLVDRAHAHGLFIHTYTVNEMAVLDWVRRLGVDGVFTDRPGLLRAALSR